MEEGTVAVSSRALTNVVASGVSLIRTSELFVKPAPITGIVELEEVVKVLNGLMSRICGCGDARLERIVPNWMKLTVPSFWFTIRAMFEVGSIATAAGLLPTVSCVNICSVCRSNTAAVLLELTATAMLVKGLMAAATYPVAFV